MKGVRRHLKKSAVKPWQRKQWRIPEVSADFVAHMEDVPDLYAEPCDPQRPVVCFGETPPGCWPTPTHPGEARTC